jgi:amidase
MGRSLDTIHLAMKAVLEAEPWKFDARCSPIPWRQDAYDEVRDRPLVVGILLDDEVVRPHPPISRVLKETTKVLGDAGHEIVEWNAQYHAECIEVMVSSCLTGSSLQLLTIELG